MKVLVIGGTGLISTSIVDQLIQRGDQVTVYNRGKSEKRFGGGVGELHGDKFDAPAFEAELQKNSFDAAIDMMSFSAEHGQSLLRAVKGKVQHLVVCSTVCVYGGYLSRVPATDDEPHKPVSGYGRNKSLLEGVILAANGHESLSTTILRPSHTTGEGSGISGLLFDDSLISRLRHGRPVVIHDDGNSPWAMAHVSDVARGFMNALLNEKAYGQSYHLTSDEHTTWDGIYRAMAEAAQAQVPQIAHAPSSWLYRVAPRRSVGIEYIFKYPGSFNNAKARHDLGFKTSVTLVETLRRSLAWMESKGKLKKVSEEPLQDILVDALMTKKDPAQYPGFVDYNPWGNSTTS